MAIAATDEANGLDLPLVELIRRDHGVEVSTSIQRFSTDGWSAQGNAPIGCSRCATTGRPVYRKPYTTSKGSYRYWAIVCVDCKEVDELSGIRAEDRKPLKQWDEGRAPARAAPRAPSGSDHSVEPAPRAEHQRWVSTFSGRSLAEELVSLVAGAHQRVWLAVPWWRHRQADAPSAIFDAVMAARARGVDVRVLIRNDASNTPTIGALSAAGVGVRCVRYLHFKAAFADDYAFSFSANFTGPELERNQNTGHYLDDVDVREAEEAAWRSLWSANAGDVAAGEEKRTRASEVVPPELRRYLPREELNPLQSKAMPVVLSSHRHVLVVAPTGSGKTDVGAAAVLRSIVLEGRKAVYLSPARALTRELSRNFDAWAALGLKVLQVTGEDDVDAASLRTADLWVATIEKFESLYRRATLAQAIADVGCIVIDEIHLVGDVERGATVEALLARLRHLSAQTRLVGLSATVANAEDIASWLDAELVRSDWRPVQLSVQVMSYDAGDSRRSAESAKDRIVEDLVDDVRSGDDAGQAIVFCGSKWAVDHTAALLSGATGEGDALAEAAKAVGVGLHYRGLSRLRATEEAFRRGDLRVLVATTGLAAGVNLPARVVIIRDDTLGQSALTTGDALQMLGRAGRAGLETEGHGFLLVPEENVATWRRELAGGYSVVSHIVDSLADHILADVLLGRLRSRSDLEQWFASTLAFFEGAAADEALQEAVELLLEHGFVEEVEGSLRCTAKGEVTARFLVPVRAGAEVLVALQRGHLPLDAPSAEQFVLRAVASHVPEFRDAHVPRRALSMLEKAFPTPIGEPLSPGARKTLYAATLALEHPDDLSGRGTRSGFAVTDLRDLVNSLPRYLGWLAALGTAGGWPGAVGQDLAARIEWRAAQPQRGHGRLLRFLAELVPAPQRRDRVPTVFARAVGRGYSTPWDIEERPKSFPVDDAVWDRLPGARASIRIDDVEIADGSLVVRLETKTTAPLWVLLRAHAGGQPTLLHTRLETPELRLPLPDGAWNGRVVVEALAFTRSDWTYDDADVATTDVPSRLEMAERQVEDLVARVPATSWKGRFSDRLASRDRRRRARAWALVDSAAPMLGDLASTLGGSGSPVVDAKRFVSGVLELVGPTEDAEVRHPVAVLRSRRGNASERALVIAAMLLSAGWEAGLAEHGGDFLAAVRDAGQWYAVHERNSLMSETIAIHPTNMGSLTELSATACGDEVSVDPALAFLTDFRQARSSSKHPSVGDAR